MTANTPHYTSSSLYVGDLHPAVTEAILFDLFKSVGPVASIRVCRDAISRRSLGYAYVNFHNTVDAERALDTLNYAPVRGKPCRIMWSHRDPSVRKSGQGNVFIKNLDKSIDNKALYDTFSTFGNILSCKVVTDSKGNSKGYGFVHYETQEAADQAINKVHGMLLSNKIVFVGPFIPRKERVPGSDPDKFTNLYVKHLHPDTTEPQLKAEFEKYGPIQSAVIMRGDSGESKKFGFVNFVNHEDAGKAVESINGKLKIGKSDKEVYVTRAQKRNEREMVLKKIREERAQKYQGINLYVKYLDDSVDDQKLREHFSEFGTISSCKVMRDEKTNSKGFGFVCFTTPDEASKAVTQLHNTLLVGKPIYVALAERKDMRCAKLEAQYSARRMAGNPGLGNAPPVYPVFYSQAPQQARQGYVPGYPGGMVGRPRWPTPAAGGQARQGPYPSVPGYVGVPHPGAPRARQNRGGQSRSGAGQGQIQGLNRFKYTPNARNQHPGQNVGGKVEGGHGLVSSVTLTSGALASASPEERKQILGESLFPRIRAVEPVQAGKITGMLLESLEPQELLGLLDSPEALQDKVEEARSVLKEHLAARQGEVVGDVQEPDEADG